MDSPRYHFAASSEKKESLRISPDRAGARPSPADRRTAPDGVARFIVSGGATRQRVLGLVGLEEGTRADSVAMQGEKSARALDTASALGSNYLRATNRRVW